MSSSHVAILSDCHFGIKKNKDYFINSQLQFFSECLVPYLKTNDIDTIFILGDLFDNRNMINVMTKNEVFNLFDSILSDFNIFLLVGNHDSYFNSSIDVNSLKFFGKFSNVTLIEEMRSIELCNKKITMVPWIVDDEKFVDEFSEVGCDVCMGHFEIVGSRMNKAKLSDIGIQKSIFSKCKKVFSGHFHTRSTQSVGGCDIIYVGSPMQFNRGDMEEDRGFIDFNLETLDYEYINNDKSIKFVKLNYPEVPSVKSIKGNLVDIYADSNGLDDKSFEKYLNKIESMEPIDTPTVFVVNTTETNEIEFKITEVNISSIPDLMLTYTDSLKLDNQTKVYEHLIGLYRETKAEDL